MITRNTIALTTHIFVSKEFSINLLVVDHGEDREVVFKEGQGGKSLGEGSGRS